jgi:hypothetical protein
MKTIKFTIIASIFISSLIFMQSCKTDDPIEVDPFATEFITEGTTVTVVDHGEGTGTMTFTADKTWVLGNFVFVNSGQTLTIEAGTVIKGKPGEGESATALIVAAGGKINAVGTETNPIIFTALADDLNGSVSLTDRGLWGGLILLGNAKINTIPNQMSIEGIPTTETRGIYGGSDDADNSGVLKYISIRHGGTNIGADNEINGLTLAGIGSETVIEHIEVIANNDDGFEFFGGTVQTKYLISAYNKDDCFDYDQGFSGKGQFWLAIQADDEGDRLGEFDGADDPENGTPFGIPTLYNLTFVGNNHAGGRAVTFRANAGGKVFNSIILNTDLGVDIELKESLTSETSYKRMVEGDLRFGNNILYAIAAGSTDETVFTLKADDAITVEDLATAKTNLYNYLLSANNAYTDPGIVLSPFNPIPSGNVSDNLASYSDSFFEAVTYKGAFGTSNWALGWTLLFE